MIRNWKLQNQPKSFAKAKVRKQNKRHNKELKRERIMLRDTSWSAMIKDSEKEQERSKQYRWLLKYDVITADKLDRKNKI